MHRTSKPIRMSILISQEDHKRLVHLSDGTTLSSTIRELIRETPTDYKRRLKRANT